MKKYVDAILKENEQYNLDNFGISRKNTISGNIDKKNYPKALSIDLPMPNYMELS